MIRRKPSARWNRWPPAASAFDFTLGNIYFQNEDLTNAVKHFEAALAKFRTFAASRRIWLALVRATPR